MDLDIDEVANDKRLNQMVALSVALLSVAMGLGNTKDGNIVQAMQVAKSDSVDRWSEYQASRIKGRIVDAELTTLSVFPDSPARTAAIASLNEQSAEYRTKSPVLAKEATALNDQYDALNVHDDQFDAAETLLAAAIAMAAVSALAASRWLLAVGWVFGAAGLFMEACGFLELPFHPDILSKLLG